MKLQALETYKAVHRRFPENVECLKFLVGVYSSTVDSYILSLKICLIYNTDSGDPQVKLCSDMGLKEAGEFALELKKAERAKEVTADNQQRHQHHHDIIVIIAKIATIIITIVIIAMTKHHYWNGRSRSREQSARDLAAGEAVAG